MYPWRTEQSGARRPIAAVILRALILLAFVLSVAYLLPHTGDISDSLMVAQRLAWPVLVLAVAAQFFSYISSAELLRATLRQSGHTLSMSRATIIEIATSTLSLVPGGAIGSTAAVYRWTRKGGVPSCSAAVTGFVVTLFNASSLLFFGVVSAVLLIGQHRLAGNEAIAVAIVSVAILATIVVAIVAAIWPSWLIFILSAARRLPLIRHASWLQRADDSIAQLRATVAGLRRGKWGRAAASAALNVAFDAATLALVFYAAGARVGTATLLAGYGLPIMLGQASLLPGGLAVTEFSMSALYISLGLRPSVVIASVVTYRLVSLWLPALIGLPLIVYLQLKGRRRPANIFEAANARKRASGAPERSRMRPSATSPPDSARR
jgi:uncharacterized protein (TIRG00374 family)